MSIATSVSGRGVPLLSSSPIRSHQHVHSSPRSSSPHFLQLPLCDRRLRTLKPQLTTSTFGSREVPFRFSSFHTFSEPLSVRFNRRIKCAASSGDWNRFSRLRDEPNFDPFWLSPVKDTLWSLRSLVLFLLEQPSQLKYIEWPSFQNTLKTATLTLTLVAVLIVALSSVDATLSFLLSVMLRRKG